VRKVVRGQDQTSAALVSDRDRYCHRFVQSWKVPSERRLR
jgi:hypothetical protein